MELLKLASQKRLLLLHQLLRESEWLDASLVALGLHWIPKPLRLEHAVECQCAQEQATGDQFRIPSTHATAVDKTELSERWPRDSEQPQRPGRRRAENIRSVNACANHWNKDEPQDDIDRQHLRQHHREQCRRTRRRRFVAGANTWGQKPASPKHD